MERFLKGNLRTRKTAFSYQCHACNKCCHGKGIQVNPYESIRLSSFLRITTTEFIGKYLNGQTLKHKQGSNACIFLGEKGCTVHKNRPLSCRLYPLGRLRMADGKELFTELTQHSESAGEYGDTSTVNNYLVTQEVASYLKAERAYLEVIVHMSKSAVDEPNSNSKQQIGRSIKSELNYADWILDPDPVIKQYCGLRNIRFPLETEEKLKLHLEALRVWANGEWEPKN